MLQLNSTSDKGIEVVRWLPDNQDFFWGRVFVHCLILDQWLRHHKIIEHYAKSYADEVDRQIYEVLVSD